MTGPATLRRALLCAAAALALAAAVPLRAQDAQTTAVQKSAREWLAIVDTLDAGASWKAAGERFRNEMSADAWASALQQVRAPLGAIAQRSMVATSFSNRLSEGPEGEFALVVFRTAFATRVDGRESITLEREADGTWRVVGYLIR